MIESHDIEAYRTHCVDMLDIAPQDIPCMLADSHFPTLSNRVHAQCPTPSFLLSHHHHLPLFPLFLTGSHCVAQASLEFAIFLLQQRAEMMGVCYHMP